MSLQPRHWQIMLLDYLRNNRRQAPGITSRLHRQMNIGIICGLGFTRIQHNQFALWVFFNLTQESPPPVHPVAHIRILTGEHHHLRLIDLRMDRRTHHLAKDKAIARLLLRSRVTFILHSQGRQQPHRIGRTQLVTLATAPIEKDLIPPVNLFNGLQLIRDFLHRLIPTNGLIRAI